MNKMSLKVGLVFICLILVFNNVLVRSDEPIVKTSSGSVKGLTLQILNQSIDQYLGIPYAEPPVGSLRFSKPIPISNPIEGIIDATKAKHSCTQRNKFAGLLKVAFGDLTYSEDCLTLNIWTSKSGNNSSSLKPVMFWMHGGGLSIGSIYQPIYNGSVLATHDVVFVSVNYRLNFFGYLYGAKKSAPGDVGFYDQLLALKWVRENIHLFGGDKNLITILGQSGGSWSVSAHLMSPLSNGLFKRAIMQSGALFFNKERPQRSKEEAFREAKSIAKQLKCTADKHWLQCLRRVEAKKFIPFSNYYTFPIDGTEFLPFSSQKAFNDNKFNKDLDIMAGTVKHEGNVLTMTYNPYIVLKSMTKDNFVEFIKEDANPMYHNLNAEKIAEFYLNNTNLNDSNAIKMKFYDVIGDLLMKCPTYHFAKRYAEQSSDETNVYFYELTHKARDIIKDLDVGIYHGADIDFVFGLPLLNPDIFTEENIRFSKEVMKLWTDFAKYGKPDNNWPKLLDTKSNSSVTTIKDLNPKDSEKYINNLFAETCDGFWKSYY